MKTITITNIIENNKRVAFICNSFADIKNFITISEQEGIVYSKGLDKDNVFIQEYDTLFDDYTKHLHNEYKSYILVVNVGDGEYQFYARSEADNYTDWDRYNIINWTQIHREFRLKGLLDD